MATPYQAAGVALHSGARPLFQLSYFGSLPNDPSMRSLHIGLPMVAALCFVPWIVLKRHASWIMLVVLAYLLGTGGPLYQAVIAAMPPLGLSRFPIGDYKHLIAIGLIVVAIMGLDTASTLGRVQCRTLRTTALWTAFVLSVWVLGFEAPDAPKFWWGLALALSSLALIVAWISTDRARIILVPCMLGLLALDAARVELGVELSYWIDWNGQTEHRALHGDLVRVAPQLSKRIAGVPCRPARDDEPYLPKKTAFKGYFTGDYMVEDYSGPMQFVRQRRILADPVLKRFAVQPWRALAVEGDLDAFLRHGIDLGAVEPGVRCAGYRINDQTLAVELATPRIVVENETYHTGWHGRLIDDSGRLLAEIEPFEVLGFRAWRLPAGRYRLVETFETPWLRPALAASLAGVAIWLGLAGRAVRSSRGRAPGAREVST